MVIYSVTVNVNAAVEADWRQWMNDVHIPDVMATGFFEKFTTQSCIEGGQLGPGPTFRIQYTCESLEKLERYQSEAAPALKQDHSDRYAGQVKAYREILTPGF